LAASECWPVLARPARSPATRRQTWARAPTCHQVGARLGPCR